MFLVIQTYCCRKKLLKNSLIYWIKTNLNLKSLNLLWFYWFAYLLNGKYHIFQQSNSSLDSSVKKFYETMPWQMFNWKSMLSLRHCLDQSGPFSEVSWKYVDFLEQHAAQVVRMLLSCFSLSPLDLVDFLFCSLCKIKMRFVCEFVKIRHSTDNFCAYNSYFW